MRIEDHPGKVHGKPLAVACIYRLLDVCGFGEGPRAKGRRVRQARTQRYGLMLLGKRQRLKRPEPTTNAAGFSFVIPSIIKCLSSINVSIC
jgi:hypothetical protein